MPSRNQRLFVDVMPLPEELLQLQKPSRRFLVMLADCPTQIVDH